MGAFHRDWYAAFVKTGEEERVKARLEYRFKDGLRFLFPKRRLRERKNGQWNDVLRPLFPGYILINGPLGVEEYYKFKKVPGFWRLLSGEGGLVSIPQREIEFIDRLMENGEVIGPSSLYREGGRVRVIDGPLTGMEGRIVKIDNRKGRAKVIITFLNEDRLVDLAVTMLG